MTHDMKMDGVRTCEAFLVVVRYHSMAMLDIDESAVLCLSTHSIEKSSPKKQWAP
jgi:hypothetical protein